MDIKQKIEKANEEAARRLTIGEPVLVDIAPAGEVIPGLKDKMIIHSGPPIVINLGLGTFAKSLEEQQVDIVQVDWVPPAGGDKEMMDLLDQLL